MTNVAPLFNASSVRPEGPGDGIGETVTVGSYIVTDELPLVKIALPLVKMDRVV